MSTWLFILIQITVIAYAFVGGVFLAFSDFIMRSLARTDGAGGVTAMQVINKEVFRWIFMALFLGLAPVSLILAVQGGLALSTPAGALLVLAGGLYLVGCFGVTVLFNVPMNEALGRMDPGAATTEDYWTATYLPRWTFWNSVRTACCAGAALFALLGLLRLG